MDEKPIKQMNDYTISKWVNGTQIRNSELMFGTETVRVRLFSELCGGRIFVFVMCAVYNNVIKGKQGEGNIMPRL